MHNDREKAARNTYKFIIYVNNFQIDFQIFTYILVCLYNMFYLYLLNSKARD